jgi:hypothetical protein
MLDGASNNNTMLVHLKTLLSARGLSMQFDPVDNQVQCYMHTIDLSSKVVIGNWPNDMEILGLDAAQECNLVVGLDVSTILA